MKNQSCWQHDATAPYLPFKGFVKAAVKAAMAHVTAEYAEDIPDGYAARLRPYEGTNGVMRINGLHGRIERKTGRVAVFVQYSPNGWASLVGVMPDLSCNVWAD